MDPATYRRAMVESGELWTLRPPRNGGRLLMGLIEAVATVTG